MLADVPDDEVVPRGIVPQLVRGFPALRHAYFRRYMLGQSISLVGFWMQAVAQSWLVFRLSGSPFALGAVASAAFLPVAFVSPFAGVLADRVSRHRLVMVTQSAAMLLAVTLGVLVVTDRATVPLVGIFAFTLGVVGAVDLPTRQAFLVEMVGPRDLSSAIALNASIFNAARIVGPAIAGGLVATVGEASCFFLNGASYLAVLSPLASMRFPPAVDRPAPASRRAALGEGFRYVQRASRPRGDADRARAWCPASRSSSTCCCRWSAERIFGRGASGYGMLLTAFGIGAVVSALRLASRAFTPVEHRRHLLARPRGLRCRPAGRRARARASRSRWPAS